MAVVARKPVRVQDSPLLGAPFWATARGAGLIVAVLAVVAYAGSLGNDFSYDEGLVIARAEPFLRSGSVGTLFSRAYFAATFEGTWRPVCTLTYMLDAMISNHATVFKASNLLWHIAAALLVMALARRLLPERGRRFAVVAGLVLALHPVTSETVDNASFREDALVTVFTLATLVLALDGRRALALVSFALGLLSKESAMVAPALLAVIRLARIGSRSAEAASPPQRIAGGSEPSQGSEFASPPSRAPRPSVASLSRELWPYGVVAGVYLALRFGPMNIPIAYARYPGGTFMATLAALPAIWTHHLRLLLVPWPLCADMSGAFEFGPQPWLPFIGALGMLGGYGYAVWRAARAGHTALAFGLSWFVIALLPVSNLIPIPIPAAERFLYLPLAGIGLAAAAAVGVALDDAPARVRRGALVGAAVIAALWLVAINVRHRDWRNDEALWRATVAINPSSCGAQSAVGGSLLSRGMRQNDPELLRAAADRQELAVALCPDDADVVRMAMMYTRLGAARALLGELPAAHAALDKAVGLAPRYALAPAWLGYVAFREGDRAQAAVLLQRSILELGPPDGTTAEVARLYLDQL